MSFFDSIGKFLGSVGGGVVGSIASGGLNFFGQNSANSANRDIAAATNKSNLDIAQKQMDFQKEMSSTAWQRGVADMQAAGINPILAASQGGASSPPGAAVGAVTGAPMHNSLSRATEAFNSALQAKMMSAQFDQVRESTRKTMSDIDLNNVLKVSALADAHLKTNNAKVAAVNARNASLQTPGLVAEAALDNSAYGKIMRAANRSAGVVNSAVSVKHAFSPKLHVLKK